MKHSAANILTKEHAYVIKIRSYNEWNGLKKNPDSIGIIVISFNLISIELGNFNEAQVRFKTPRIEQY